MKKAIVVTLLVLGLLPSFASRCGQAWNCCVAQPQMRVAGGSACVGYYDQKGDLQWIEEETVCVYVDCSEML